MSDGMNDLVVPPRGDLPRDRRPRLHYCEDTPNRPPEATACGWQDYSHPDNWTKNITTSIRALKRSRRPCLKCLAALRRPPEEPRACEDCGETSPKGERRLRCPWCKKLVCPWCRGHVHNGLHVKAASR